MNAKKVVTGILVVFVIASIAFAIMKEGKRKAATPADPAASAPAETAPVETAEATPEQESAPAEEPAEASAPVVTAYYFHTSQRCVSCKKIEAYTHEAITGAFKDALDKGTLVWSMVNVDEPENQHFVKDYGLYTKSVVLVEQAGGKQTRWKNLEEVWNLLNDKDAFETYIKGEVKAFLAAEVKA